MKRASAIIGFCLVVSIFLLSLSLPAGVIEAKTPTGREIPIGYIRGNYTYAIITEDRDFSILPFFSFPTSGGVYSYSKGLTNFSAAIATISQHFRIKGTYALTEYYEVLNESGISPGKVLQRFWNPSFIIFSIGVLAISISNSKKDGRKGLSYAIPFLAFLAGPYAPFAFLALYLLISGVQENIGRPKEGEIKKVSWRDIMFLALSLIIIASFLRISPLSPLPIVLSGIAFSISLLKDRIGKVEGIIVSSLAIFFASICWAHYYLLYLIPKILLSTLAAVIACCGGENKIIRGISASLIAYCSGL